MPYYSLVHSNEEIYHFGIKGMKWGIRRFQNRDGSLTNAGRIRQKEPRGSSSKQASKTLAEQIPADKGFVVPKGSTVYRLAGSDNFMKRGYTFVDITSDLNRVYEHQADLKETIDGKYDRTYKMHTSKALKFATAGEVYKTYNAIMRIDDSARLSDIPKNVSNKEEYAAIKGLWSKNARELDTVYGHNENTMNRIMGKLKSKGYDGYEDPADVYTRFVPDFDSDDGQKLGSPMSIVLFNPKDNLEIDDVEYG